ncbi:site-specific integrase [Sphingobium sp. DEHP117]|uniref:tyrosine-type recombinase/integrase n=1 Tax=Sphingobium sp. DEHP117 TaxID=2993436 RepID=UPI001B44A48F|nr:tyrosine-type recombinase/integrase [Sphingobium sp. DEHP117]MBP8670815.1 site-specific integrase [Sphingobium sp.]MBP9158122.1 site-specific integrase [Sphingobium sp.]MDQ4419244.1 site-specific integrase [Sphingobium sp. DEHP117]
MNPKDRSNFCAANALIIRQYEHFLREAQGLAETTIVLNLRAIADYEKFTSHANFKSFSADNAVAYKRGLLKKGGRHAAEKSSRATVYSKLRAVERFFRWLSDKPTYKSRIQISDTAYFRLSNRDVALTRGHTFKDAASLEQLRHVISLMPSSSAIEKRNRALLACTLLTGVRIKALITLKLKHMRADNLGINQDAEEVGTKFAKTIPTAFFPVGDDIRAILLDYVQFLKSELHFGNNDPLFPSTRKEVGEDRIFHWVGLTREHWETPEPVRRIFREAFAAASIPYFSPHTVRNTLVLLGQEICVGPADFKAWSQNLGHESTLTTFNSYGHLPERQQISLIQSLANKKTR